MPELDDLTDAEHAIRERIQAKLGDPPERYKPIEDYTPAEHEARHRGERVVSDEYREYEAKARRAAGLDNDEPDLEDPATHAARRYGAEGSR